MIDFILGLIVGGAIVFAYFHFKGETPAQAASELLNLEQRIRTAMSQAGDDIVAKLKNAEAAIDAKLASAAAPVQAQLDAATADHQADLTNIGAATDALAAKVGS